jgi:hypothetical protein
MYMNIIILDLNIAQKQLFYLLAGHPSEHKN